MGEFVTEKSLKVLLADLSYEVINGSDDRFIEHLVYDSRKIAAGDVFLCIVGASFDGHDYIAQAAEKKAAAAVVSKDVAITEDLKDLTIIKVEDTRMALAMMSAAYFKHPAKELFTIGVTGTKGKTTTTFMIREILEACGIRTGLISTNETIVGEEHIQSPNTTPESYLIQQYFRQMVEAGCTTVVLEVSSQALKLHRTGGIQFDLGVLTNLEKDHIGPHEHESIEEYIECKGRLFRQCKHGIVNVDNEYTKDVIAGHTCTIETYGLHNTADYMASDMVYGTDVNNIVTGFLVSGKKDLKVQITMPGEFSVYNALCAIAVTEHLNITKEALLKALYHVQVEGRVEIIRVADDIKIVLDYAHNAMSIESLLNTLRQYQPKRLVTLFGCDGDRTKIRRYDMGYISTKLSDFTVITTNNPRFEEPEDIIAMIEVGAKDAGGEYIKIVDRTEAIRYVIHHAKPGDIIVVTGKGHENTQEVKGVKYHLSDKETILETIASLNN